MPLIKDLGFVPFVQIKMGTSINWTNISLEDIGVCSHGGFCSRTELSCPVPPWSLDRLVDGDVLNEEAFPFLRPKRCA